ncbi:amidohydrolase [Asanoa ishikariensis]|uniref:Imidazolonepropionase n=1 Tax=Asanoa ishikariensis TaxID=137265 RepID=A0A1H3MK33_9ACTN|nr:amidohydrolase family protein [Asanoa ishikariensis]GIF66185.1 amidohydrolase [Asanoa ishikariensis]SDY77072.1 Imidazolonepropionase [Asanoa ishikariensis]
MQRSNFSRRSVLAGAVGLAAGAAVGGGRASATPRVPSAADRVTAITHVTVIDATGAPANRDMTVLLRDGRVLAVEPSRRVGVPVGADVIDGRGKFLIPGLANMHNHTFDGEAIEPPLNIANGITTVREMSANADVTRWNREVEAGTRLGPRWTVGSPIVDGEPSLWEGLGAPYVAVATPEEARATVRAQKAAGADFVKVYTRLSRASFYAIADEARRQRIPFLGHVSDFVQLTEASDAGLASVEHLFQVWYDTSSREDELRRAITSVPIAGGEYNGWLNKMHPYEYAAARSFDRHKAAGVFARLARNGTRVTPTLVLHTFTDLPGDTPMNDPRYAYVPAATQEFWQYALDLIYLDGRTPEQDARGREIFERRLRLVHDLDCAGVPLMAGTDNGTAYLVPGFSLHDELARLSQAGLSNMRVLQTATLEPARYLGAHDRGTIERGKVADLVLLDADPLRDIRNTTRINSVVVRGQVIDPAARQLMLDDVRKAAAAVPPATAPLAARCPC